MFIKSYISKLSKTRLYYNYINSYSMLTYDETTADATLPSPVPRRDDVLRRAWLLVRLPPGGEANLGIKPANTRPQTPQSPASSTMKVLVRTSPKYERPYASFGLTKSRLLYIKSS